MLTDLKHTIKQSAIYGLTKVGSKAISFVLLPLYTSIFTSATIANINLLETFWQYLYSVCLLGFENAIITFYSLETNEEKRKKLLFTFFGILLLNSCIFLLAGHLFSDDMSKLVLNESGYGTVINYCFLISIFESLLVIPLTILRLKEKPQWYLLVTISSLLINLSLQLYFIKFMDLGYEFVFISKFIAPGVLTILLIPYTIKNLQPNFELPSIKNILRFSVPLMFAVLLSMLLNSIDRYILVDFVSKDDVAVYTIGYSIGSVCNFFILAPFVLAFNIIAWRKKGDDNAERFFTKTTTYLYFVMIIASLIISLLIPWIIKLFVRNTFLWSSVDIIRIILFSNCVAALFSVSSLSFYFAKKSDFILLTIFLSLVFKFVANLIFIRYYGIYASAYISVLSYIVLILLSYNLAKRYYLIRFENRKLILLSLLYIFFTYISSLYQMSTWMSDSLIKCVYIALFFALLYIVKFFEPIEIERIRGFVNKYLWRILMNR